MLKGKTSEQQRCCPNFLELTVRPCPIQTKDLLRKEHLGPLKSAPPLSLTLSNTVIWIKVGTCEMILDAFPNLFKPQMFLLWLLFCFG